MNAHLEYVIEVTAGLRREPESPSGARIVRQAPAPRHFTAQFKPL